MIFLALKISNLFWKLGYNELAGSLSHNFQEASTLVCGCIFASDSVCLLYALLSIKIKNILSGNWESCPASFLWRENDVRGILSINMPLKTCGCLCENLVVGDGSGEVTVQLLWWWIALLAKESSSSCIIFLFPYQMSLKSEHHILWSSQGWGSRTWRTGFGAWKFFFWGAGTFLPGATGWTIQQEIVAVPLSLQSRKCGAPWAPGAPCLALGLCSPSAERSPWSDHGHSLLHSDSGLYTCRCISSSVPRWCVLK